MNLQAFSKSTVVSPWRGRMLSGKHSAISGIFLLCLVVLFSDAQAQSAGERAVEGLKQEDWQNTINISYKYIFNQRANEHNRKYLSAEQLKHYPLIIYDLDHSQTPNVRIGEELPDFLKAIAFQYVDAAGKTHTATIDDFSNGKLLVLDFWATWCSPCVESMDKWNTIAEEMDGEVSVLGLLIDHDFRAQYYGSIREWTSPIVFGPESNIINSFFFDRSVVSRMAWIMDGRLIAITGTKGYDLQLVRDLLAGKSVDIPMAYEWTYSQPKN